MRYFQNCFPRLFELQSDDSGQDLIEYAVLGGLIAIAAISSLMGYAGSLKTVFSEISSKVIAAS